MPYPASKPESKENKKLNTEIVGRGLAPAANQKNTTAAPLSGSALVKKK